jgi:tetratricopeptide (TPR) repeat protein
MVSFPLVLAALTYGLPVRCQSAEASWEATQLTAQQQEKLKERDRYGEEADKHRSEGKLKEAIAAAKKMLAVEREVYGDVHEEVAGSLEMLADMHEQLEAWDAARKVRQEVLEIKSTLFGKGHYRATDARLALTNLERLSRLRTDERRRLKEAKQFLRQVLRLFREGKSKSAIPMAERLAAIRKELLGDEHPSYVTSLNNLAVLYESTGEYAKAEPLYVHAKEIRKRILGEEHPHYVQSLNNLGLLYHSVGDYAKAEALLVLALEISERVLGEQHLDYAQSLNNLGLLYHSMGKYSNAEPL